MSRVSILIFSLILSFFCAYQFFFPPSIADSFFCCSATLQCGNNKTRVSWRAQSRPSVSRRRQWLWLLNAGFSLPWTSELTWVVVELRVQVLLFGVELVVDAVHGSHQGEGSDGGSDEQAHFCAVFIWKSIFWRHSQTISHTHCEPARRKNVHSKHTYRFPLHSD